MTKDFFASRKPSVVLPFIVFPSNRWQLNLSPPVHTCVASFSLTSQHHAHWSFHPTSFARYFIAGNLCELVGTGWYFSLFWTTPTPNLRATYHPRRWIHLDARLLGPGTMTSVITTGYPVLGFSPPQVGYLWTPGWWGWGNGGYFFHEGFWGPTVGFYGGINYGFGYVGTSDSADPKLRQFITCNICLLPTRTIRTR
jgi:hypothetical protein